eukprot:CAMPEP_0167774348 /NCGR_PEP_ID=MMETSP0111_2-20121227/1949_1 /TAXON_ID=91324 /ORGANISM="Lotharella globosa, Strain CCCM811" /LENGTH=130 /DNA_ID=CAMNT_0007664133 /DNA_START=681 /DNA_END=1073 /DNA_ORIENTATION=-
MRATPPAPFFLGRGFARQAAFVDVLRQRRHRVGHRPGPEEAPVLGYGGWQIDVPGRRVLPVRLEEPASSEQLLHPLLTDRQQVGHDGPQVEVDRARVAHAADEAREDPEHGVSHLVQGADEKQGGEAEGD